MDNRKRGVQGRDLKAPRHQMHSNDCQGLWAPSQLTTKLKSIRDAAAMCCCREAELSLGALWNVKQHVHIRNTREACLSN
eukprot:1158077-Pelagomonas_calceolata.AAC.9